ncbi:MAG: hypothetical protein IT332_04215 [Ardenticatenales bacterium]|nr:hypothetical protein [Ardenticatenales bacterium]
MSVALLHATLSRTALFFTGAIGVWSLWLVARNRGIDGRFMGALVIGETLMVFQIVLGVALSLERGWDAVRYLHVLYGVLAALMWPFVYTFAPRDGSRRETVMFSATTFFLFLLLVRAVTTAVAPR